MLTTSVVNFHRHLFCIYHEREWCTQVSTCYSFQFSPKMRQTMPLYDYLTPKLDFKRKFNHRQSFLYKGRLTVRTIRKLRIGSSLRIESRIGSSIRNRISKLRRSLVWTATHHRTSWTIASRSPVLILGGICVLPTVIYSQYRVFGSTLTAVGLFQLPALLSGTLSRILPGTLRSV